MKKILLGIGFFIALTTEAQVVNKFRDSSVFFKGVRFDSTLVFKGLKSGSTADTNVVVISSTGKASKVSKSEFLGDLPIYSISDSNTVINYDVLNSQNTPPVSPNTGDVYLVGTVPTGAWVGHAKDIAEWNGSAWVFTDGVQGDFLYNATNALTYIFRSGNWVQTTGIPALNNGNTTSSGLKIGTNNSRSLTFETNNVNRGRFDSVGRFYVYDTSLRKANKYLQIDSITGRLVASEISGSSGGGGGGASLSGLTAATTTNTINNANNAQEWQFNSLANGVGLKLSSNSTLASSNTQSIFEVENSGANANASQTTYGARFFNTKIGSSSTNIGAFFSASGANNNFAIEAQNRIKVSNSGSGIRDISFWSSGGENARIGTGYNGLVDDNIEINQLKNMGIVFKINNTEKMRISAFGHLGIGEIAPSFPLTISTNHDGFGIYLNSRIQCNNTANSFQYTATSNTYSAQFGCATNANTAVISASGNSILYVSGNNSNVGIGVATPNTSAKLDVVSTTQGFLPPRMTATQASAIASPAQGLMLFVTDTNGTFTSVGWWGYNGSTWEKLNN